MVDDDKHIEEGFDPSFSADGETPLDTMRLSEAVIELNIARKNVSMYPPGHAQVERSIGRAHAVLKEMTSVWPKITIGVAKDTILIGEDHLDSKNPVFRDFASALNRREIAAVTFLQGLKEEEVARFGQIIVTDPDKITKGGGIEKVVSEAQIPNIMIQALDFSGFHLTEEEKIVLGEADDLESEASMWQGFVSQLMSDTLDPSGQALSAEDSIKIDPAKLAKFLNESEADPETAAETYERIVAQYIRRVTERAQLTEAQSATLASFVSLIQNLKPELRKQFLSVTSRSLSSDQTPGGVEDLLEGFPDDMVIEMMRQINEEGGEIPQALMNVVQRMTFTEDGVESDRVTVSGTEDDDAGEDVTEEGDLAKKEPDPHISREQMETLFEVKAREREGDAEYDATLKALSEAVGPEEIGPGPAFPIDDYKETLEESHINLQTGQALLIFMKADIDDEHYGELVKSVLALLPDLLENGQYSLLLEIHKTLKTRSEEEPPASDESTRQNTAAVRKVALEALKTFDDPDFVSQAVSGFANWADTKGQEAAGFFLALGPNTVPGLIDLYAEDESPGGWEVLFKLLVNFGEATVSEALQRLDDTRSYFVRNLLLLIRHAGTHEAVPHVRPLVKHEEQEVRMEALAILLKFRDPTGILLLREALLSKDKDESSQAVSLAGRYGGDDVAEDLVSMIKRRPLLKSGYQVNERIIKALGEIGSPQAVPHLERLARSRWMLYPGTLLHMKAVLFESLEQYAREHVEGLLHIGAKLDDPRIKRAYKRIVEGKKA